MLNEFWMFVANVLAHWQATVTGGAIAMALLLVEHWTTKNVTWKVLWYLLGMGLFISCFLAWRDEHRNSQILIAEKAKAFGSLNVCQSDLRFSERIRDFQGERLNVSQESIDSNQSTISTCVTALAKLAAGEPEATYLWGSVTARMTDKQVVTTIVMVTSKPVTLRGYVSCTQNFKVVKWVMLGIEESMGHSSHPLSPKEYYIRIDSPVWEPIHPVLITALADKPLDDCKFEFTQ